MKLDHWEKVLVFFDYVIPVGGIPDVYEPNKIFCIIYINVC